MSGGEETSSLRSWAGTHWTEPSEKATCWPRMGLVLATGAGRGGGGGGGGEGVVDVVGPEGCAAGAAGVGGAVLLEEGGEEGGGDVAEVEGEAEGELEVAGGGGDDGGAFFEAGEVGVAGVV